MSSIATNVTRNRHVFLVGLAFVSIFMLSHLAQAETTIWLWHFFGGGPELEAFLTLVDRFEQEHPDIHVDVMPVAWGDEYYEKLSVAVAADSAPDVALMHATKIAEFVEGGFLRELTDDELRAAGIDEEDYFPIPWQASTYEGKVYALPFDIHPIGLYINRRVLAEAGVDPTAPGSGQELFELARRLNRDADGDGVVDRAGFGVRDDGYTFYRMWYSILGQSGLNLLDETQTGLNSDARLMTAYQELVDAHDMNALVVGGAGSDFVGEKVAFFVDGTWASGGFVELNLDFAAAPFPVFGDEPATWTDSHLFVLPRQTSAHAERLEASKTFVKWMTQNNGEWSATAGHVSPSRQVLQSPEFQALGPQLAFAQQLNYVTYFPQVIGAWSLQSALSYHLHRIMSGNTTLAQGFEDIRTEFANILDR